MPRIIAGTARGTRLVAPAGQATRPTGDRVKEALFSILTPRLPAEGFLDLYAGTGQIGLEAASRGSTSVVLVENNPASLTAIRTNVAKAHMDERVTIMASNAARALSHLHKQHQFFDLIFLDPPYRQAIDEFIQLSSALALVLAPDGLIILEHDANIMPPPFVTNLQLTRSCQYGSAMISFYKADPCPSGDGSA